MAPLVQLYSIHLSARLVAGVTRTLTQPGLSNVASYVVLTLRLSVLMLNRRLWLGLKELVQVLNLRLQV